METTTLIYALIALLAGLAIGYIVRHQLVSKQAASIEQKIKERLDEATAKSKELVLEAQEKSAKILEDIKRDEKERKLQLDKIEERLLNKEEHLEKQSGEIRDREKTIQADIQKLA